LHWYGQQKLTAKSIKPTQKNDNKTIYYLHTQLRMHTNVIQTNTRRTQAQCNYTNTKQKAWFRRLLRHPAKKWTGPILHPRTHMGEEICWISDEWNRQKIPMFENVLCFIDYRLHHKNCIIDLIIF